VIRPRDLVGSLRRLRGSASAVANDRSPTYAKHVSLARGSITGRLGRASSSWRLLGRPSRTSRFHVVDWIVIAGFGTAFAVLGYLGLRDEGANVEERFYGTLQLFLLQSDTAGDVDTKLDIARFGAPLIAGIATITVLLRIFRERVQLFRARFLARGHSVVVGLGDKGSHLVTALRRDDRRVVAIEWDATRPEITGCRERGIPVIVGDATDPVVLRRAGLAHAAHLVTTCGDDGTNVNVVFAAQRHTSRRRRRPLEALAHIDDPDLRGVLQARAIELWSRSTVLLECFNVFEDAAPMLLEQSPFEDVIVEEDAPELLIVGVGRLGQAIASHAAQRWYSDSSLQDKPLGITLMGPDASRRTAALRTLAAELSEAVELRGEDVRAPALDLEERVMAVGPRRPAVIFVTAALETNELTTAFALHRSYGESGIPIVVSVRDDRSGVATTLEKADMTGLHEVTPFALFSNILTPRLLRRRTREIIARVRHAQYLRDELGKGMTLGERASLVPWRELDPRLKDSNRDFADRIGETIEDVGCTLVPRSLSARPDAFAFPADRLEELAEKEHESWVRSEAARNRDHPSLVPWSELSEEEKEKDREAVRAIPRLVAQAGFEMRRRNRAASTTADPAAATDSHVIIDDALDHVTPGRVGGAGA
jgi:voltage-gated potassium channel Kch